MFKHVLNLHGGKYHYTQPTMTAVHRPKDANVR